MDGTLVGFTIGGWGPDNDGGHNYGVWGTVDPAWRRRGIGAALLRWTEARQRQVAAGHPASVTKRLESWAHDAEAARIALLEGHGYAVVRYFFLMDRPTLDGVPPASFPDGVEVRPVREEQLPAIFEMEVAAFRDHFGGIDDTPEAFERMVHDPRRNSALWVVAWHGDEIVGQSLNRIDRAENEAFGVARGWVNAVGVRREWRSRGIGRALVAESLRRAARGGHDQCAPGRGCREPARRAGPLRVTRLRGDQAGPQLPQADGAERLSPVARVSSDVIARSR